MTNAPFGTLYIGVTSDLARIVYEHRTGTGSDFCKRYGLTKLVYCEEYPTIDDAIRREKMMKAWKRAWKTRTIETTNPNWDHLFQHLVGL